MVKALKLEGKDCKISVFKTKEAVAVCSALANCPKKDNRYELDAECFKMEKDVEWAQYREKLQ